VEPLNEGASLSWYRGFQPSPLLSNPILVTDNTVSMVTVVADSQSHLKIAVAVGRPFTLNSWPYTLTSNPIMKYSISTNNSKL